MSDTILAGPASSPGLVPPQALEAERAVLAAMMLDESAIGVAVEHITSQAFYRSAHAKLFDAIVALYNASHNADLITVREELHKRGDLEAVGGAAFIAQIIEYSTTTANVEHHVKIVRSKWMLRQLIKATQEIQQMCYAGSEDAAEILDQSEARVFNVTDQRVNAGFTSMQQLISPTFSFIEKLAERKQLVTGVPSGWDDLDKLTSGWQPGDLVILAGRPSMGKTSAVMNMAENAAIMHGKHVAVFSLEMSKEQLALRLLCSQAEVDLHKVRTGFVANNDWSNLTSGAARLSKASIYIDDAPGQSLLEIRAKCRRLRAQGKLDLVVIDYLQLMRASGPAENRVQEISQISRGLKAIAKELGVPVIALSQLSRAVEQRGGSGRPQLSDLRESGSIEQDADVVMFVYREVVYKPDTPEPNKAQIIIAKQRNGPTDDVDLTFLRGCTKFVPYSPVMPGETDPGF